MTDEKVVVNHLKDKFFGEASIGVAISSKLPYSLLEIATPIEVNEVLKSKIPKSFDLNKSINNKENNINTKENEVEIDFSSDDEKSSNLQLTKSENLQQFSRDNSEEIKQSNYQFDSSKIDIIKPLRFKNINIKNLEKKYNLKLSPILPPKPIKTRSIISFSNEKEEEPRIVPTTILSTDKEKTIKLYTCLKSIISNESLPLSTDICCFHDCHQFDTPPLFCPIKYHPSKYVYNIFNQMTKELTTVRVSITEKERERIERDSNKHNNEKDKIKDNHISDSQKIIKGGIFEGDGIFCSFECILAFLEDKKNDNIYRNSRTLILKLYRHFFGYLPKKNLVSAPSKRMLKMFGGPLNIQQFRASFQKIEFINTGQFEHVYKSLMPIGAIFEANEIFSKKKKISLISKKNDE